MINLETKLLGNIICHGTRKIIQKHLPNFKLSKTVGQSDLEHMREVLISEKITKFKFLILFYKRSGYYFYTLNIRDTQKR